MVWERARKVGGNCCSNVLDHVPTMTSLKISGGDSTPIEIPYSPVRVTSKTNRNISEREHHIEDGKFITRLAECCSPSFMTRKYWVEQQHQQRERGRADTKTFHINIDLCMKTIKWFTVVAVAVAASCRWSLLFIVYFASFFRELLRELSHTATIALQAHHDAISIDEMRTTTTIESSREEFNHFMCSCFWCALLVELTRDERTHTHAEWELKRNNIK